MTEQEWRTCVEPQRMFDVVGDRSERKLILCACGICRELWDTLDERSRQIVESADSAASFSVGSSARTDLGNLMLLLDEPLRGQVEQIKFTDFMRCVYGSHAFRPVVFDYEWLTPTVVAIARQIYESRDFSAMPILADALQDAGCDDADILDHCRDEKGTHVRGCWVVDLVLGKE